LTPTTFHIAWNRGPYFFHAASIGAQVLAVSDTCTGTTHTNKVPCILHKRFLSQSFLTLRRLGNKEVSQLPAWTWNFLLGCLQRPQPYFHFCLDTFHSSQVTQAAWHEGSSTGVYDDSSQLPLLLCKGL
jgi:hypothetical protein